MSQVTLKDVAEQVGKSVSAVSKALAGASDISPDTVAAVHKAVDALGYVPNAAASQLKKQRTDTVGLVLPQGSDLRLSDPSFSEFLDGLVEELESHDLGLLLTGADENNEPSAYQKQIRSRRVDSFVIVRTRREDARIALLRDSGAAFVAYGRTDSTVDCPFVDEDGAAAVEAMVDHLVELGHTRLVCLAEPSGYAKSENRVLGFRRGMEKHGLAVSTDCVVAGGYSEESGHEAAGAVLDRQVRPTALVCSNDRLALGAMQAARERGLLVGRDVSVTGFDDMALASHADPPLTTIRSVPHDSGRIAGEILQRVMSGDPTSENQVLLQLDLVVRDSTGPPDST